MSRAYRERSGVKRALPFGRDLFISSYLSSLALTQTPLGSSSSSHFSQFSLQSLSSRVKQRDGRVLDRLEEMGSTGLRRARLAGVRGMDA